MGENCTALKEIYVIFIARSEADVDRARQRAEDACAEMKGKTGDVKCIPMTPVGRPSEVITTIAREKDVDLILMGGHGKGLSRLLMGHITEKVIGRAHCAVLVVEKTSL